MTAATINMDTIELSTIVPSVEAMATREPLDGDVPIQTDRVEDSIESSSPEVEDYPRGFKFYMIIVSLTLAMVLNGFDNNVVATAVPAITDHFHTVSDIGWYSVAYRLSLCAFQFVFGKLYTLFSIKRVFLASMAIMQLGSLLCATAASSTMFVFGRAVTGFGAAGVLAGVFTLLTHALPLRRRPVYSALLGGIESASELSAPIVGGILTQALSWRWCFYISIPFGAISFAVIAVVLSDPQQRGGSLERMGWRGKLFQLDLLGTLVFLPCATCLFLALSWAGTKYTWSSPTVIGLLIAFTVLLAVFIFDQHHRRDTAVLPLRILRHRSVFCGLVFSTCCAGSLQVLSYYLPTYFQAVRQYSPAKSGYNTFPIVIGFSIGMILQGMGTTTIGFYTPFMLLCSILSPVAAGLMTTCKASTPSVQVLIYSAFVGFALGCGYQGPQVAVQTTLSPSDASLGLSVILFAQHFGPALFVTVAQTLFSSRLSSNLQHSPTKGLNATTIQSAGLTDLKSYLSPEELPAAIMALDESLLQTWYLPVGLTCVTMLGSLGMEWRSVKKKQS